MYFKCDTKWGEHKHLRYICTITSGDVVFRIAIATFTCGLHSHVGNKRRFIHPI